MSARASLEEALRRALEALDPEGAVYGALPSTPEVAGRVTLIAVGKAAPAMARGALRRWGDRVEHALVVSVSPVEAVPGAAMRSAGHPIPDGHSLGAAEHALTLAGALGRGDLLLALVSGGASALMAAPREGASLADKQALVASLLERGVGIRDVNLVRRHASRVKGGLLARAAAPAETLTLIVSDVIGGAPHDVGSGPTVADPTTADDARAVLERVGLPVPPWIGESLKEDEGVAASAKIVLDPAALGRALGLELRRLGLAVSVDPPDEGDVRVLVERRLARAATLRPGEAVVVASEPTIVLPPQRGRGGRAGWLALAAMRRLPPGVTLLAAASDGVDGSSGAGGAIVSAADAAKIHPATIDDALTRRDDAAVHRLLGTHLAGGPTGHNLADVHALVRR